MALYNPGEEPANIAKKLQSFFAKIDEYGIVKKCAVGEYPKSWIGRSQAA